MRINDIILPIEKKYHNRIEKKINSLLGYCGRYITKYKVNDGSVYMCNCRVINDNLLVDIITHNKELIKDLENKDITKLLEIDIKEINDNYFVFNFFLNTMKSVWV